MEKVLKLCKSFKKVAFKIFSDNGLFLVRFFLVLTFKSIFDNKTWHFFSK